MGASQLAVVKTNDTMGDDSPILEPKTCAGSFAPAQAGAYADAGWTAARVQAIHEPGDVPIAFEILQGVVEFPTADAAQTHLTEQMTRWVACSGSAYSVTYPNSAPRHWKFGPLTTHPTTLSMPQISTDPAATATGNCQHALAVRNNVIADVWACRLGLNNQAVDLANAILAKVPH